MRIGLFVGLCAIVLALLNGSHFNWESGEGGADISIQIGSVDLVSTAESITIFLGVIAVVAFVLGGAVLSINRQKASDKGGSSSVSNEPFSFIDFVQKLKRSKKNCQVGGVCGGLGECSPIPAWVWRMLFLIFAFCFGVGILPYIILWICIPETEEANANKLKRNKKTILIIALLGIVLAVLGISVMVNKEAFSGGWTTALKKYAAESLGEDDQLVVLGGGSIRKGGGSIREVLDGAYYSTVYIDFRGSGSEKRYRARLYRDSFLSGWKREIVKLPPEETPNKAMHTDADKPRR